MSKAIEFAVRDSAGGLARGFVAGDASSNIVKMGIGDEISLNLAPQSITNYAKRGDDLVITLVDGREVVLDGYFNASGEPNQLYLSQRGEVMAVEFSGSGNALYAQYGAADGWDKFSTMDDLRFAQSDDLAMMQAATDDPAGMAPFLPGLVGLGGVGAGIAGVAVVGAVVGGGGGGGGDTGPRPPTVNDPTSSHTVTTETTDPALVVSGTGEPGTNVTVTVGTSTGTTVIGDNGTWTVTIPGTNLPPDGTYESTATFEDGTGGTPTTLDGPTFILDLTPPDVAITEGAKSNGDVENAVEYTDGVTIGGTGEVGAAIVVEVNGHTQTTTVSTSGTWTVTFPTTQIPAGEYETAITVTATDALGNDTVIHDTLVVDTVPHPITFNSVTADNTVNASESAAGFTITGTSTAGAVLTVTVQGVSQTVTVGTDGSWSATWTAGSLTAGEYDATVTATTTDAAGNSSTSTHTFRVDTTTSVAFDPVAIAGDNVINATEAAAGVTLTGTAQPGATVQVSWGGTTLPATVSASGAWSVVFPATAIAAGTYASTATVTATDAAGNTATATRSISVDTELSVSINAGQAGGDDVVSGAEHAAALTITGRGEPGATLQITLEGVTKTVSVDASGNWQASYASGEYRAGTYDTTISVTATDAAGNVATATRSLHVDTEVSPFAKVSDSSGADGIVNAAEATAGLTVTGVVEPGSTVTLRLASGTTVTATVAADGSWTALIPAGQIPAGESTVPLVITATDAVGNSATLNHSVAIDTIVRDFARTGGAIGGDGIINAAEAEAGITFGGTVEPFSTVVIRLGNGQSVTASAGADGLWSATFTQGQLPAGEGTSTVTMTATDAVGNTRTLTETFTYDTVMPDTPTVISFDRVAAGLRGIGTEITSDSYSFTAIDAAGNVHSLGSTRADDTFYGETEFRLSSPVPDGSYLVIDTTDTAGNQVSTLLIVNNTTSVNVNLSRTGLSEFDLNAIDLTFAPEANLTITAAQLEALTGTERELIVKGDADDKVNLDHATATGATRVIDGETYLVYSLGTGTVLVDDDIQTTII
ncbi:Ig-like domain-containing protein [Neotabrizicola sp. VNH66]|uniref:Ig-like domain-containing protein n=1 Tax=Neotabrizicola sp. VNH66 TaxID=3400918 RepID=UPI003C077726